MIDDEFNFLKGYIVGQSISERKLIGPVSKLEVLSSGDFHEGGACTVFLNQARFFCNPHNLNNKLNVYTPSQIFEFMKANGFRVTKFQPYSISGFDGVYNIALPTERIGYLSWARLLSWFELDSGLAELIKIIQCDIVPLLPWFYCERALLQFEPGVMEVGDSEYIKSNIRPDEEVMSKVVDLVLTKIKSDLNERASIFAYYLISALGKYELKILNAMPFSFQSQYEILKRKDMHDSHAKHFAENWWKNLSTNNCLVYNGVSLGQAMEYELLESILDGGFNSF